MKTIKRPYPHFKFPNEIIISVTKMTESECQWHNVKKDSYEFRCINYGWFPTEIVMGVINGKFSDTNKIGADNGNNLGTAGIAIIDKDTAIKMLKDKGYNIILK